MTEWVEGRINVTKRLVRGTFGGKPFRNIRGLGSAAWAPTDITELYAWYDAQAETGFSNNDPVGTLTDQKGSNDLTQATAARKPLYQTSGINGYATILFDGGDDFLSNASKANWQFLHDGTDYSTVVVLDQDSAGSDGLWGTNGISSANQGATLWVHASEYLSFLLTKVSTTIVSTSSSASSLPVASAHYVINVYDNGAAGNDSTLRIDGSNNGTSDTLAAHGSGNATLDFSVGAAGPTPNYPFDGHIGEIQIYKKVLDATDISNIESYLTAKWGL